MESSTAPSLPLLRCNQSPQIGAGPTPRVAVRSATVPQRPATLPTPQTSRHRTPRLLQCATQSVSPIQRIPIASALQAVHHPSMLVHRTFRLTGGPGGIDHVRKVMPAQAMTSTAIPNHPQADSRSHCAHHCSSSAITSAAVGGRRSLNRPCVSNTRGAASLTMYCSRSAG